MKTKGKASNKGSDIDPQLRAKFPLLDQRLILARLSIEMLCNLTMPFFAEDPSPETTAMVARAVFIGHMEGRPMSATKIAGFLRMPRTTVLARLKRFVDNGLIYRDGNVYLLTDTALDRRHVPERVLRTVDLIINAAQQLVRLRTEK